MPHQRPRELLGLIEKRLSHFPIVGVLGARQTGKSTLLRELLEDYARERGFLPAEGASAPVGSAT